MENSKTLAGQAFWEYLIKNACGKVREDKIFRFLKFLSKPQASQKTDEIMFQNQKTDGEKPVRCE